ncbi:MAG: mechanosensitive ion channel [Desulfobulbaceae bacterium]|nr:mechanosensitive ion channel [Desulfobulbaceae bacterium]
MGQKANPKPHRRRHGPGKRTVLTGPASIGSYQFRARSRLKGFKRFSLVAVSLVALFLLVMEPAPGTFSGDQLNAAAISGTETIDPGVSAEEATGTVRALFSTAYSMWPKFAIALLILLFAWLAARLLGFLLRRVLPNWSRAEALATFSGVTIFILAVGIALSVIAGDVRALVGSVGLVGLALSWALQAPIESFTGWLLNSFKGYYHQGDRIAVGEVLGDVFRIDILTTTVWESGGPDGPVQGAQPTGALITFPNSEVLRNNIVNYTRDFPYVWDEITIAVANESDLAHAMKVVSDTAGRVMGTAMSKAADEYRKMLSDRKLLFNVGLQPEVYAAPADSWIDLTIRYLVPAREKRRWASELFLEVAGEMAKEEHRERILPAAPRLRVEKFEP